MAMNHFVMLKLSGLSFSIVSLVSWIAFVTVNLIFLAVPPLSETQGFPKSFSLIEAAQKGNKKEVEKLLAQGTNVDFQDEYGDSALLSASRRGFVEIVKILLDAGAQVLSLIHI